MLGETFAELVHFLIRRDEVPDHDLQKAAEPVGSEIAALEHERLFLALILQRGLKAEVFEAVKGECAVFLEELRQVEVLPSVVGLLVEIHGPDADLRILEIGHDDHDEIVRAHVAEQADEAALVEFHQLLGDPDRASDRRDAASAR